MKTIIFSVTDEETINRRVLDAVAGKNKGRHYMSFATVDLMWRALSPNRWQIIQLMMGQKPMSLREIARRASRDVHGIHGDLHALLAGGIIDRTDDGRFTFPYDAVHVDFTVTKKVA